MKTYTIQLADDEVLVALKRGEDYEDVHPELVAEDAHIKWPEYRVIYGPPHLVPVNARPPLTPDQSPELTHDNPSPLHGAAR